MSLSWLRRLEVALSPAGAAWACGAARGYCEGAPAEAFAAALAAAPRARRVAVTLGGSLVHCLLVPWPAQIEDEAEGEALAGHHFRRVFGEQAAAWEIRVDAEEGATRLAFAAPRELLEALRAAAGGGGPRGGGGGGAGPRHGEWCRCSRFSPPPSICGGASSAARARST